VNDFQENSEMASIAGLPARKHLKVYMYRVLIFAYMPYIHISGTQLILVLVGKGIDLQNRRHIGFTAFCLEEICEENVTGASPRYHEFSFEVFGWLVKYGWSHSYIYL